MPNNEHFTPPIYNSATSKESNIANLRPKKKVRDSNLELLRILSMLTIIAHHYVVNSTVIDAYDFENPTPQQYFLEIWGMWGKTAINSFILISGYFLCKMEMTWQRYFKLLIHILVYGIIIMLIFGLTGYEPLSPKLVFKTIFGLFIFINNGFTASFMVFYAFVPFYNKLINSITKQDFQWLLAGLIFVFTITSNLFFSRSMNEPLWYMTLYLIASYIRIFPNKILNSLKIWMWLLSISIVIAIFSVVGLTWAGATFNKPLLSQLYYFMVVDSNKILPFIVGLSSFLVAKNLPVFHNKFINLAAAGTFGVLLIHTASDTMRQWLWQDIFKVHEIINADMPMLIIHALTIPLIIFSLCSFIDYFYRKWIENILFSPGITEYMSRKVKNILNLTK